jgi:hypothetical protein
VDARERIWRARQADSSSPDPENLPTSENVQEQLSLQTIQTWIRDSLGPTLGLIQRELQGVQRNQNEGLSRLQGEMAYVTHALSRRPSERQRERWIAGIACIVTALIAGGIAGAISPRISSESQRLQRLGTALEATWQAMSPAERKQLEKRMGWNRPSEPDAR